LFHCRLEEISELDLTITIGIACYCTGNLCDVTPKPSGRQITTSRISTRRTTTSRTSVRTTTTTRIPYHKKT